MVIKHRHVMAFLSLFLLSVGGNLTSVHAQEAEVPLPVVRDVSIASDQVQDEAEQLRSQIDRIQEIVALQGENTDKKIQELKETIKAQRDVIDTLKVDLKSMVDKPLTNGTTFEVWSGILLGCVAIMVTVLSVMLAFFQYTGIKNAIREAKEVANDITPKVAKEKLFELVKEGGFDDVIEEAVDRAAFSNIVDPENYNEGDTDE